MKHESTNITVSYSGKNTHLIDLFHNYVLANNINRTSLLLSLIKKFLEANGVDTVEPSDTDQKPE